MDSGSESDEATMFNPDDIHTETSALLVAVDEKEFSGLKDAQRYAVKAKNEIVHLNSELSIKLQELEERDEAVAERRQDIIDLRADMEELQEKIEYLEKKNKTLTLENEKLRDLRADPLRDEQKILELQNKLSAARKEFNDTELRNNESFSSQISTNNKIISELQSNVDELKAQLASNEASVSIKTKSTDFVCYDCTVLKQELQMQSATLAELEKTIEELREDLEMRMLEIEERDEAVASRHQEISDLKGDIDDLNDQIETLELRIVSLKKDLVAANKLNSQQRAEMDSSYNDVINEAETLRNLQLALNKANEQISYQKVAIGNQETEIFELRAIQNPESAEVIERMTEYASHIAELDDQIAELNEELEETSTKLEQRDEALADRHQELNDVKFQLEEMEESLEEAKKLIGEYKQEIANAECTIKSLEEELRDLRNGDSNCELSQAIADLKAVIINLEGELSAKEESYRSELEVYEARIALLQSQVVAAETKEQSIVDELRVRLQEANDMIDKGENVQRSLDNVNNLLGDKDTQVAGLIAEILKLEQEKGSLQITIAKLESGISESIKERNLLEMQYANLKERLRQSEVENKKLTEKIDDLNGDIEYRVQEIEVAQELNEDLENGWAEERLDYESQIEDLQKTVQQLDDEKEKLVSDLTTSKSQFLTQDSQCKELTFAYNELKTVYDNLDQAHGLLEMQFANLKEKLRQSELENKKLLEKIDGLNGDIEYRVQEIEVAQELNEDLENGWAEERLDYESQIEDLQKTVQQLDDEKEKTLNELSQLHVNMKSLVDQNQVLTNDLANHSLLYEDANKSCGLLEMQYANLKERLRQSEVENKKLTEKIDDLNGDIEYRVQEIEVAQELNEDLENGWAEERLDYESQIEDLQKTVQQLDDEKENLVRELTEEKEKLRSLDEQLNSSKNDSMVIKKEYDDLYKCHGLLEMQYANTKEKLRQSELEVRKVTEVVGQLKDEIELKSQEMDVAHEMSQDLETGWNEQRSHFEAQVEELHVLLKTMEDERDMLESEIKAIKSSLKIIECKNNDLTYELEAAAKLTTELKEDIADANHQIHELEDDLQKEGDKLTKQKDVSNHIIQLLKDKISDLEKQSEASSIVLREKENSIIELVDDLEREGSKYLALQDALGLIEKNSRNESILLKDQITLLKKEKSDIEKDWWKTQSEFKSFQEAAAAAQIVSSASSTEQRKIIVDLQLELKDKDHKLYQANSTVESLQEQIDELTLISQSLSEKDSALQKITESHKKAFAALSNALEANAKLEAELALLSNTMEEREDSLSARHQELIDIKCDMDELQEELDAANEAIDRLHKDIADGNHIIHSLKDDLEKEGLKYTALKDTSAETINFLNERISELEAELVIVRAKLSEKEAKLTSLLASKTDLIAEREALEQKLDELEMELAHLNVEVNTKEDEVESRDEALAARHQEIFDLKSRIEDLEEQLETTNTLTISQKQSISEAQSAIQKLKEDIEVEGAKLVKHKEISSSIIESLKEKIDTLTIELQIVKSNVKDKEISLQLQLDVQSSMHQELSTALLKIADLAAEKESLLSSTNASIKDAINSAESLKTELSIKDALILQLQTENAILSDELRKIADTAEKERLKVVAEKERRQGVRTFEDSEESRVALYADQQSHDHNQISQMDESFEGEVHFEFNWGDIVADKTFVSTSSINTDFEQRSLVAKTSLGSVLLSSLDNVVNHVSDSVVIASQNDKVKTLTNSVEQLQLEIVNLQNVIDLRNASLTENRQELNDIKVELDAAYEKLLKQKDVSGKIIDVLKNSNLELKTNISSKSAELEISVLDLSAVRNQLVKQTKDIDEAKESIDNLTENLRKSEELRKISEDSLDRLKLELSEKIELLNAKMEEFEKINTDLSVSVIELERVIFQKNQLQMEVDSLNNSIADISIDNNSMKSIVNDITVQLTEKSDCLVKSAVMVDQQYLRIIDLETELAVLKSKIEILTISLSNSDNSIAQYDERVSALGIKNVELEKNLLEVDSNLSIEKNNYCRLKATSDKIIANLKEKILGLENNSARNATDNAEVIAALELKIVELNVENERLSIELEQRINTIASKHQEVLDLTSHLRDRQTDLVELQSIFNAFKMESVEKIDMHDAELKRLEGELESETNKYDEYKNDTSVIIDSLTSENTYLTVELNRKHEEVLDLARKAQNFENIIIQLQNSNEIDTARIIGLEANIANEVEKFTKYKETSTGILNSLKDKNASLMNEIALKLESNKQLNSALAQLKAENELLFTSKTGFQEELQKEVLFHSNSRDQMMQISNQMSERICSLEADLADLKFSLNEKKIEISKLCDSKEFLGRNFTALQVELSAKETEVEARDSALATRHQELVNLRADMEELADQLMVSESKISDILRAKVKLESELGNKIIELQKENFELSQNLSARDASLSDTIELNNQLGKALQEAEKSIEIHINDLSTLSKQKEVSTKVIESLRKKVEEVLKENTDLDHKAQQLLTSNIALQKENELLDNEVNGLKQDLVQSHETLDEKENLISHLKADAIKEFEQMRGEISVLMHQIEDLRDDWRSEVSRLNAEKQFKISELESDLKGKHIELADEMRKSEELSNMLTSERLQHQSEINSLADHIKSLQLEIEKLQKQREVSAQLIASLKASKTELQLVIKARDTEYTSLSKNMSDLCAERDDAVSKLKVFVDRMEQEELDKRSESANRRVIRLFKDQSDVLSGISSAESFDVVDPGVSEGGSMTFNSILHDSSSPEQIVLDVSITEIITDITRLSSPVNDITSLGRVLNHSAVYETLHNSESFESRIAFLTSNNLEKSNELEKLRTEVASLNDIIGNKNENAKHLAKSFSDLQFHMDEEAQKANKHQHISNNVISNLKKGNESLEYQLQDKVKVIDNLLSVGELQQKEIMSLKQNTVLLESRIDDLNVELSNLNEQKDILLHSNNDLNHALLAESHKALEYKQTIETLENCIKTNQTTIDNDSVIICDLNKEIQFIDGRCNSLKDTLMAQADELTSNKQSSDAQLKKIEELENVISSNDSKFIKQRDVSKALVESLKEQLKSANNDLKGVMIELNLATERMQFLDIQNENLNAMITTTHVEIDKLKSDANVAATENKQLVDKLVKNEKLLHDAEVTNSLLSHKLNETNSKLSNVETQIVHKDKVIESSDKELKRQHSSFILMKDSVRDIERDFKEKFVQIEAELAKANDNIAEKTEVIDRNFTLIENLKSNITMANNMIMQQENDFAKELAKASKQKEISDGIISTLKSKASNAELTIEQLSSKNELLVVNSENQSALLVAAETKLTESKIELDKLKETTNSNEARLNIALADAEQSRRVLEEDLHALCAENEIQNSVIQELKSLSTTDQSLILELSDKVRDLKDELQAAEGELAEFSDMHKRKLEELSKEEARLTLQLVEKNNDVSTLKAILKDTQNDLSVYKGKYANSVVQGSDLSKDLEEMQRRVLEQSRVSEENLMTLMNELKVAKDTMEELKSLVKEKTSSEDCLKELNISLSEQLGKEQIENATAFRLVKDLDRQLKIYQQQCLDHIDTINELTINSFTSEESLLEKTQQISQLKELNAIQHDGLLSSNRDLEDTKALLLRMSAELGHKKDELSLLKDEKKSLLNSLNSLTFDVNDLKTELEKTLEQSTKDNERLAIEVEAQEAEIELQKNVINAQLVLLDDNEKRLTNLTAQLETAEKSIDNVLLDVNTKEKQLSQNSCTILDLEQELLFANNLVVELEKSLHNRDRAYATLLANEQLLHEQICTLESRLGEFNVILATKEEEFTKLETKVCGLVSKAEEVDEVLQELQSDNVLLTELLRDKDAAAVELESCREELARQIDLLKVALCDVEAKLVSSEQSNILAVSKLESDIKNLIKENNQVKAQLEKSRDDIIRDLKNKLHALLLEKEAAEELIACRDFELSECRKNIERNEHDLSEANQEIGKLQQVIMDCDEVIKQKCIIVNNLTDDKEHLQDNLNNVEKELEDLRKRSHESMLSDKKQLGKLAERLSTMGKDLDNSACRAAEHQSALEGMQKSMEKDIQKKNSAILELEKVVEEKKVLLGASDDMVKLLVKQADKARTEHEMEVRAVMFDINALSQEKDVQTKKLQNRIDILENEIEVLKSDAKLMAEDSKDEIVELKALINHLEETSVDQAALIAKLESEVTENFANHRVEVMNQNAVIDQLQRDIEVLSEDLEEAKAQLVVSEKEVEETKNELLIAVSESADIKSNLARVLAEKISSEAQLVDALKEIDVSYDKQRELNRFIEQLQDLVNTLNDRLNDAEKCKNAWLKSEKDLLARLDREIAKYLLVNDEKESLASTCKDRTNTISLLDKEVESLRTQMAKLDSEFMALNAVNVSLKLASDDALEHCEVLKEELEATNEVVAKQASEIATSYREVGKVNQMVLNLEEKLAEKNKKLHTAEDSIVRLKSAVLELNSNKNNVSSDRISVSKQ